MYSSNYPETTTVFSRFPILSCFLSAHFCSRKYLEKNKHKVGIWRLDRRCLTTIPVHFHSTRAEMLAGKASSRYQFARNGTFFMTLSGWGSYSVPLSEKWFSGFQLTFLLAWQQQNVYLIWSGNLFCLRHLHSAPCVIMYGSISCTWEHSSSGLVASHTGFAQRLITAGGKVQVRKGWLWKWHEVLPYFLN